MRRAELLALPREELEALLFCDVPVSFTAGSAELLAAFHRLPQGARVELAHVDGGGEGVLLALWSLAHDLARAWGYRRLEWVVHALDCAEPNPRLQALLRARGFTERELRAHGRVLWLAEELGSKPP